MAMDDDMQTFARKVRTNGDKIRAMTDEELADFLDTITDCCSAYYTECDKCPMKFADTIPRCNISLWLKKEAEHDS